jgi:hypothetical protein
MIVYKVVKKLFPSGFGSVMWDELPQELKVEYKVGVPVKAAVGRCFAFKTKYHANGFRAVCYDAELLTFEAQCGDAVPVAMEVPQVVNCALPAIKAWWAGQWNYGIVAPFFGTVLCDFIMLERQV